MLIQRNIVGEYTDKLYLGVNGSGVPPSCLNTFFENIATGFLGQCSGFKYLFDTWWNMKGSQFSSRIVVFTGDTSIVEDQWNIVVEGKDDISMQQFVDDCDGKASLILLLCSGPTKKEARIISKESLVVYGHGSTESMSFVPGSYIMHVPGYGDFVDTKDEKKLLALALTLGGVPKKV